MTPPSLSPQRRDVRRRRRRAAGAGARAYGRTLPSERDAVSLVLERHFLRVSPGSREAAASRAVLPSSLAQTRAEMLPRHKARASREPSGRLFVSLTPKSEARAAETRAFFFPRASFSENAKRRFTSCLARVQNSNLVLESRHTYFPRSINTASGRSAHGLSKASS